MPLSDYKIFELAPLEKFDRAVFLPVEKDKKRISGFVLCLALAHNDLGDVAGVWSLLLKQEPIKPFKPSPIVGQYFGMLNHLHRQYIALLFAFFDCIKKNEDVLAHPLFVKVISHMNRDVRKYWEKLVQYAIDGSTDDPTLNLLTRVRNSVTFHFDPKELQKAYQSRANSSLSEEWKTAYISRGETGGKTRYYFADGAAQQYFHDLWAGNPPDEFWKQVMDITVGIQNAVEQIVLHSVQINGGSWQEVK